MKPWIKWLLESLLEKRTYGIYWRIDHSLVGSWKYIYLKSNILIADGRKLKEVVLHRHFLNPCIEYKIMPHSYLKNYVYSKYKTVIAKYFSTKTCLLRIMSIARKHRLCILRVVVLDHHFLMSIGHFFLLNYHSYKSQNNSISWKLKSKPLQQK